MAYITLEEYAELYGQPTISEADFPVYASQASDLIDSITQYRIIRWSSSWSQRQPLHKSFTSSRTEGSRLS